MCNISNNETLEIVFSLIKAVSNNVERSGMDPIKKKETQVMLAQISVLTNIVCFDLSNQSL